MGSRRIVDPVTSRHGSRGRPAERPFAGRAGAPSAGVSRSLGAVRSLRL